MNANNAPLRGFKQMDYEGDIHVPFIVSWPAQLEGGGKREVPMWSIDLFATALDAAGVPMPKRLCEPAGMGSKRMSLLGMMTFVTKGELMRRTNAL